MYAAGSTSSSRLRTKRRDWVSDTMPTKVHSTPAGTSTSGTSNTLCLPTVPRAPGAKFGAVGSSRLKPALAVNLRPFVMLNRRAQGACVTPFVTTPSLFSISSGLIQPRIVNSCVMLRLSLWGISTQSLLLFSKLISSEDPEPPKTLSAKSLKVAWPTNVPSLPLPDKSVTVPSSKFQ